MSAGKSGATRAQKRATTAKSKQGEKAPEPTRLNLVVVRGECSGAPELRELESGRKLAAVSVRAPGPDGRSTSVPVTVWEPAGWVEDLTEGADVIVVGAVRRRFFRTAVGGSAARVDVEAVFIGRAGQRRQLDAALRRTQETLDVLLA
ncbi:MAG: single-stranded DNA-binding protein [Acidimicrobiia bacterium]